MENVLKDVLSREFNKEHCVVHIMLFDNHIDKGLAKALRGTIEAVMNTDIRLTVVVKGAGVYKYKFAEEVVSDIESIRNLSFILRDTGLYSSVVYSSETRNFTLCCQGGEVVLVDMENYDVVVRFGVSKSGKVVGGSSNVQVDSDNVEVGASNYRAVEMLKRYNGWAGELDSDGVEVGTKSDKDLREEVPIMDSHSLPTLDI